MDNTLTTKLEGFLFWKGEAISIKELSSIFQVSTEEIVSALKSLEEILNTRGIRLIRTEEVAELRSAPELSELIEKITKEELNKDLGKAGLETLSIVLYEGPITRREIDYIRGVNSQFIVRNLLVRGLIERVEGKDSRSFAYNPTIELLAHLGIQSRTDLPEYASFQEKIRQFNLEKEKQKENPA